MRDPGRIQVVLDQIGKAWKRNPDLRLGQLVENSLDKKGGLDRLFYMEDAELADLIQRWSEDWAIQTAKHMTIRPCNCTDCKCKADDLLCEEGDCAIIEKNIKDSGSHVD